MEIRISHSILRFRGLTETWLLLAFALAIGSSDGHAQSVSKGAARARLSPAHITGWEYDLSGALNFLHQLFPDLNPKSKTIILDDGPWGHSPAGLLPAGLLSFTTYVCEPDLPPTEEQRLDIVSRYEIHCSAVTMYANFLMSGSQLGRVPSHIIIGRPAFNKRWSDLSAILQAHPGWSRAQVEDAMRAAGVKYGQGSRDEVIGSIHGSVKKLQPFLGKLVIDSMDYSPPDLPLSSKELSPPAWRVEAHPAGQDKAKPRIKYVLIFSAFDGAFESEMKF
jgi:hypothetical protein